MGAEGGGMRWPFRERVSPEEARRRHQEIFDRVVAEEREIRRRDLRKWAVEACLRSPLVTPSALFQTAEDVIEYVETGAWSKWKDGRKLTLD